MKAALVLTGLSRCWEQAYPSFKQYVLDRYDTDVFIDIWSEKGYYSGKGYLPEENGFVRTATDDRGFHTSGELVDANALMQTYNPVALRIEDFSTYEPYVDKIVIKYPNGFTRPKNTICQAYKVAKGMDLVNEYTMRRQILYDVVVRARPDIVLEHDPGMWELDTVYTLPSRNKIGKGTGDTIQIGNQYQMAKFADMYHNLHSIYNACGQISCPHMYAQQWIEMNGFTWNEMHIGAHVAHSPRGLYKEPE